MDNENTIAQLRKIKSDDRDYKSIFKKCPSNYMLLMPDAPIFTIVEVTDFHLKLLHRERRNVLGYGLFEIYPPNPYNRWDQNSAKKLKECLSEVVETKMQQSMIARYDVYNEIAQGFDPMYWSIDNIPILEDGAVTYILNTSVNVTSLYDQGFVVVPNDDKK